MSHFQVLKCLYRAAAQHRQDQMGDRAVGPFTRVGFYYQRGHIGMERSLSVSDKGTAVFCLSNRF